MFRECEVHLLSEITKKLSITMSHINNLTERVQTIESTVR